MPSRFVRVRIPETGAHWDCPESALDALKMREHVIEGKPATTSARQPKSRKPKAPRTPRGRRAKAADPAVTKEEPDNGENPR